jgi:hypothetical protein
MLAGLKPALRGNCNYLKRCANQNDAVAGNTGGPFAAKWSDYSGMAGSDRMLARKSVSARGEICDFPPGKSACGTIEKS